jgi:hypothetical protein
MHEYKFQSGARGYLIRSLQSALNAYCDAGIDVDGRYGSHTIGAVVEAQKSVGIVPTGEAGQAEFEVLGLTWPGEFERCLQLTAGFEGTGFNRAEGPAETSDSAGVTFGIIGFTSYNGELQRLLRSLFSDAVLAARIREMGNAVIGPDEMQTFEKHIAPGARNAAFADWALDGRHVERGVKRLLGWIGMLPECQAAQCEVARARYWVLAQRQSDELFGADAPVRCRSLMFDIAVQDGGLSGSELAGLNERFVAHGALRVDQKMVAVVDALADRLRGNRRPEHIINDVRNRKQTIVFGTGIVHGDAWRVESFAL